MDLFVGYESLCNCWGFGGLDYDSGNDNGRDGGTGWRLTVGRWGREEEKGRHDGSTSRRTPETSFGFTQSLCAYKHCIFYDFDKMAVDTYVAAWLGDMVSGDR